MIVICSGPPCSGKSTVASALRELLQQHGRIVEKLSVDPILTELFPDSDRNVHDRTRALDEMHRRATALTASSSTVILDSTYTRRTAREQFQNACGSLPLFITEFFIRPDIAVKRFGSRGEHDATDLTAERVHTAAEEFPWSDLPFVRRYDSEKQTPEAIAQQILTGIESHHNPLDSADLNQWAAEGLSA